jgi:hypothetical protein
MVLGVEPSLVPNHAMSGGAQFGCGADYDAPIAKLGGDPETAMFSAFRDEWASDDALVPEYPADETDEG